MTGSTTRLDDAARRRGSTTRLDDAARRRGSRTRVHHAVVIPTERSERRNLWD
jgi:hypothetical protein